MAAASKAMMTMTKSAIMMALPRWARLLVGSGLRNIEHLQLVVEADALAALLKH